MTEWLFQDDAYLKACEATVVAVNDRGGIVLDRTVFYPTGGGQPGDSGRLVSAGGSAVEIATAVKGDAEGEIVHVPAEGQDLPAPGAKVTAEIDWQRRHRHMRMHTALHLLCGVLDYGVTGGRIGAEKSSLDFDIADATLDKQAIADALNRLVDEDHAVAPRWIDEAELDANPDLVRTLSVQPPRGGGRIRLLEIPGVDLQPCGGTHVARTGEIGRLQVTKIENKGKRNRRVNIALDD